MKPGEVSAYFLTPELSQRLDLIRHLLANTELIPFVHAVEGSGKTRLARHLADMLAQQHTVSLISGGPMAGIRDLQKVLAETSGLKPDSEISDDLLEEQFCNLKERDKSLIVLLDDADQLAADSLSWIIRFFCNQNIACNTRFIVFSAVDVLALPLAPVELTTLRDSIQILDIPPFSESQTAAFVGAMQDEDSKALEGQQIDQLHRESLGIPGAILWQMQFVSPGVPEALTPQQNREGWFKPLAVSGGLVVVIVIGLVLLFQEDINQMFVKSDEPAQSVELQTLVLPPAEAPVELGQDNSRFQAVTVQTRQAGLADAKNHEDKPEVMAETTQEDSSSNGNKLKSLDPVEAGAKSAEIAVHPPQPDSQKQSLQKPAALKVEPEVITEDVGAPRSRQARVAAQVEVIDTSQAPTSAKDAAPVVVIEKSQVSRQNSPEVVDLLEKTTDRPTSAQKLVLRPVGWVLKQPDSNYTLQLLGVREKQGLEHYIKKHNLRGNLFIWETEVSQKPWYSLLYGSYTDRAKALAAKKSLAAPVKAKDPWPRPWAPIKKSIINPATL